MTEGEFPAFESEELPMLIESTHPDLASRHIGPDEPEQAKTLALPNPASAELIRSTGYLTTLSSAPIESWGG